MGGGPGSGIHKSTDGGETWEELTNGLPQSNMGKIGLAISPQQPDVVYAAIELDRTTGGVYRSADQGASWKKCLTLFLAQPDHTIIKNSMQVRINLIDSI